jgi:polygalacturonase
MWEIHPVLSKNITIQNIFIDSHGPNNDGCNPECCKNVLIENCYFNTGDDCIAIKSGRNNDGRRIATASENIIIKDCEMVEGHGGVVMGSEISGDVRYVFAENCVMDSPHLDRAIRIKSNSLRGGIIEHIYVRNIEVKEVREAILKINMYYGNESGDNIPVARNIKLENVNSSKSKHAVWIKTYPDKPATNIELNNCKFLNVTDKNFVEHADKILFKDVYVNNHKLN